MFYRVIIVVIGVIDTLVVFVGCLDGQPSGSFVGSSLAFVTRINPLLIADSYRVDLVRKSKEWITIIRH